MTIMLVPKKRGFVYVSHVQLYNITLFSSKPIILGYSMKLGYK